jgi:hypothetical protein
MKSVIVINFLLPHALPKFNGAWLIKRTRRNRCNNNARVLYSNRTRRAITRSLPCEEETPRWTASRCARRRNSRQRRLRHYRGNVNQFAHANFIKQDRSANRVDFAYRHGRLRRAVTQLWNDRDERFAPRSFRSLSRPPADPPTYQDLPKCWNHPGN